MDSVHLSRAALIKLVALRVIFMIPVLLGILFLPAGTFDFWEAWVWLALLLIPMLFAFAYLLKNDPELLERRMRLRERQSSQKIIIAVSWLYFIVAFTLPGFDRRFGWSDVPTPLVVAADIVVLAGYLIFFVVLRENSYASRVIEVMQGQRVISSGPNKLVRHPMYLGTTLMYVATPLALGSYWALILALLIIPIIVLRICNEESVLAHSLKGYPEYMQQTRYRLLPGIW